VSVDAENSGVELALPPVEYMKLVCGDAPNLQELFESVGRQLAQRLDRLGMVNAGARLLDIGCGCGRVARYLLDSPIAAYAGFDRHRGMIDWAQSHVASRDDRFQFEHVDVRSGYEELDSNMGTVSATDFVFPYGDGAFTGVLAASVFTHIDFPATSHYLAEAARVLVPGGRVRASFFLDETTGSMQGSGWNFIIREDDLRDSLGRAGLEVLHVQPPAPSSLHTWFLIGKPDT
jgi:SAM-dependent methyltransferase